MTSSIFPRAPRYVEHRSYTPSRTHRPLSTSIQSSEQTKYGHQSKKYRLLVSRGVTQRLHSPSLEALLCSDVAEDEEEGWIREDRQFSKARVVEELRYLGVPWKKYVEDVEEMEREEHVLEPKVYVPRRKRRVGWRKDVVMRDDGGLKTCADKRGVDGHWESTLEP